MAQALALAHQDLGTGAVVLHTRTFRQGGFLGLGGRLIAEVTAGLRRGTQPPAGHQGGARPGSGASGRSAAAGGPTGRQRSRSDQRVQPKPSPASAPNIATSSPNASTGRIGQDPTAGDLIRRTYAVVQAEMARRAGDRNGQTPATPPSQPAGPDKNAAHNVEPLSQLELAQEVRAVKRMVERLMKVPAAPVSPGGLTGAKSRGDLPEKLFEMYLALLEQEVAQELADEVVDHVRGRLDASQLDDKQAVRGAVLEAIAGLIPVATPPGPLPDAVEDRPRVIALIGPTGVGKTTTIAKLTAAFKLSQKKRVALITLDTYRIAAVDQLRTYANILGVPLHVAMSPGELADAVAKCGGYDVVLIDTAGRSQRDDPRLEHLKCYLEVAKPDEVHLVLSSTCSQPVLMDTVERFSCIPTDRIIFTKLDEAVTYGVLINVTARVKKALSYVTTGQEVPHHIEPGRADRLADIILQGKVRP